MLSNSVVLGPTSLAPPVRRDVFSYTNLNRWDFAFSPYLDYPRGGRSKVSAASSYNTLWEMYNWTKPLAFHAYGEVHASTFWAQHEYFLWQLDWFRHAAISFQPEYYRVAKSLGTDVASQAYAQWLLEVDTHLLRFMTNVYWAGGELPIFNNHILNQSFLLHQHLVENLCQWMSAKPMTKLDISFFTSGIYMFPEMFHIRNQLEELHEALYRIEALIKELRQSQSNLNSLLITFVDGRFVDDSGVREIFHLAEKNRVPSIDSVFGELNVVRQADLVIADETRAGYYRYLVRNFMAYYEMVIWAHETESYYLPPQAGKEQSIYITNILNQDPRFVFLSSTGGHQSFFEVSTQNVRFILEAADQKRVDHYYQLHEQVKQRCRTKHDIFVALLNMGLTETNETGCGVKKYHRQLEDLVSMYQNQNEYFAKYLIGEIASESISRGMPGFSWIPDFDDVNRRFLYERNALVVQDSVDFWNNNLLPSSKQKLVFPILSGVSYGLGKLLLFLYYESYFPFNSSDDNPFS